MIDMQALWTTIAGGFAGIAGIAYNKHNKRLEKIEEDLELKTTEIDVNRILKPFEVKLDFIIEQVGDIKTELTKIRKYN